MNKVLPGLFLGNYRDSKDTGQLERHKITHVVAIHDAARRLFPDKEYLCIMASDSPYQNLTQYFPSCNDFIHNARVQGGNVLIHCLAGMSRSVTIVVAYIMSITSFQLNEAQKVVRGARPVSNPNSGFQKQLQEFESSPRLFEERRRMLEKYPGTTFLESDVEYCKKLLVSYNNLLLSRAICEGGCHSARVCPTGTCRTRYPLPSPRLARLRSPDSVDSADSSSRPNSRKALPGPSQARTVGYLRSESSSKKTITSSIPQSADSSPAKSSWERHYGCWKEHFRARQASNAAQSTSNSTPASPVHYRISKNIRSDSLASINSTASVISLPAHLVESPYATPTRSPSTTSTGVPSPRLASPTSRSQLPTSSIREYHRSCPSTLKKSVTRRQLPSPGQSPTYSAASTSARKVTPRMETHVPASGSSGRRDSIRMRQPVTPEEEDETLMLVVNESTTSQDQRSVWMSSSSTAFQSKPHSLHPTSVKRQPLTPRATTGITRWVMKRSAFRYSADNPN